MANGGLALSDDAARREAVAVHDRSLLVEAGAGSGKTAVLAGRIAMLLAAGVAPRFIAAVTFTEFAASELLIRVRAFVSALAAGEIPVELRSALPDGLSEEQRGNLARADAALDEMTCSTIHGFCQRLITPYPVEADTDPLQTEIFWRLCGEPQEDGDSDDWTAFALRPGALFLVGDPKQAIYRFRGADIAAYVRAREAFRAGAADAVLSIATNFRSRAPIMEYVNARFETALSEEKGQPGFQALDPFRPPRDGGPSVAALDVAVADEDGKANAQQQRDGEAEAVAELCVRLIGSEPVPDPANGGLRPCRAGDIALLAPTGNDLWRYEEEGHGEGRGIRVSVR